MDTIHIVYSNQHFDLIEYTCDVINIQLIWDEKL
jgi:hypothetical protein